MGGTPIKKMFTPDELADMKAYGEKPKRTLRSTAEWFNDEGERVVRYHYTDILTFHTGDLEGWMTVDVGGWLTRSTVDRLNHYMAGCRITLRKGVLRIGELEYYPGIRLPVLGHKGGWQ